MKFDSRSFLELTEPVQACTGMALPFTLYGGMQNSVVFSEICK